MTERMEWTKEIPKEPGWYFIRIFGKNDPGGVFYISIRGDKKVEIDVMENYIEPKDNFEYAGPILEPKEEKHYGNYTNI